MNRIGNAARLAQPRMLLWLVLATLPLLAAVLLAGLGPITSGDLWWHLRTGEWILAEGRLPATDPFSHTAGETHWVLQEYGSQILFALVHRVGGFLGLGVLATVLFLATLFVAFRRALRGLHAPWALALTATFGLLFALKWELRPHLISVLFFFWLEACLSGNCRGADSAHGGTPEPRRLLEVFLVSMIWVQFHAEALFAPLLALAVATGAWAAVLLEGAGLRHGLTWLCLVLAALLGTLASPLLFEPHHYALVGRAAPQLYIEEWYRPWILPRDPRFEPLDLSVWICFLLTLAIGAVTTLLALAARLRPADADESTDAGTHPFTSQLREGMSWERLAFLAGCLLFALSARRFFWLTWFPLLDAVTLLVARRRQATWATGPAAAAAGLGLLLLGTHYPAQARDSLIAGRFDALVDPVLFPVWAAEFANGAKLEGNLYHPYEWGGYLGYVTGQPVFIDGRTVLFEEIIPERWTAERSPEARRRILSEREVQVIVFKHGLDQEDGRGWRPWWPGKDWLLVWTDQLARVFVRKHSANATSAAAWWEARGIELDPIHGITEADLWLTDPEWVRSIHILAPAITNALEAAESRGRSAAKVSSSVAEFELETLERMRFWHDHRMRRNLRGELRHLIRTETILRFGSNVDEAAILEGYRRRLRQNDLTGLLKDLETTWHQVQSS